MVTILFVSTFSANAALLEKDLFALDDALLTLDTDTGLEWLDLTETVGMTYGDVLASGFVTHLNFQYATANELTTLYNHAGGTGDYFVPTSPSGGYNGVPIEEHYDPAMQLLSLMGCTSNVIGELCDSMEQDWNIGFYGDQVITGLQPASVVDAFNTPDSRAGKGAIWLDFYETVPTRTRDDFGSYLVRTSVVPIPASVWLFTSGLFGLIGLARRKSFVGK
jgi:hypothetical protein